MTKQRVHRPPIDAVEESFTISASWHRSGLVELTLWVKDVETRRMIPHKLHSVVDPYTGLHQAAKYLLSATNLAVDQLDPQPRDRPLMDQVHLW